MYNPPAFQEQDIGEMHEFIAGAGLATLVTLTADGLLASHVPMVLDQGPGPFGTLLGHVSRANPQWSTIEPAVPALAIFLGPNAYVSPSLYATKRDTGKVVPTWNYVAVHAYGPLLTFHDPMRLNDLVTRLTNRHENPRPAPWAVDDAPPAFIDAQLEGIVGLELRIQRLDGKWKMSQNRPAHDWPGIADGLAAEGESQVARLVRERNRLADPPA